MPSSLRIGIEFTILLILIFLWLEKSRPGFIPISFLLFILLIFWLFNAGSALETNEAGETGFPGFITKIVVLILGVNALRHYPSLVKFLAHTWALLWVLICIQIIFAAIGYYMGLVDFPMRGDLTLELPFWFNPIFGYHHFKGFLPRFSGYTMEPIFLGLFVGLNILSAPYFVSKKYIKKFKISNAIAGILSGSFAIYLFFITLGINTFITKRFHKKKSVLFFLFIFMIVSICVTWVLLFKLGLQRHSSLEDRTLRLAIGLSALLHSTTHDLWFGNFNYVQAVEGDRAVSCGLLAVLLQKGLILFLPIFYLFYNYIKQNLLIVIYLLYYSLFLEYFWWPAFVVYLILFYCLSNKMEPINLKMPLVTDNEKPCTLNQNPI